MNGAPRLKNVSAPRAINTPVPAAMTPAVKAQAAIINIRNANAPPVLIGTRRAACVSVMALTGAL